jgi:DNA-binding winged helix-turn-helix (wHTH) protein
VELRRSGTSVKLREQSFLILVYLLEHAGEIVTREELRQLLWPSDTFVDFDHSLSTAVMKLREALGDSTDTPLYVETIPKRGYRFIAPVSQVADSRNELANSNGDVDSPSASGAQGSDETGREPKGGAHSVGRRGRQWMWLLPGGAVVVVCLAAAIWYLHRPLPPPRVTGYTQITHDGHLKSLAGTDGSRLYFNEMPGEASIGSIAQVAISGGLIGQIPVALPSPNLVDVSPDGANLLVLSVPGGDELSSPLWNVRVLGGSARSLGEAVDASYSPDANSVAYSTPEGEIWVVQGHGTGAHKLASLGGSVSDIAWSPDGSIIRFNRDNELWEMSSSGLAPHKVLPGWPTSSYPCCVRWTPDGKFFLYLAGDQIWALDERRGLFRRPPGGPIQLTTGPISWGRPIPGKDGSSIFAEGTIRRGELSRFDSKTKLLQPFLGGLSAQGVIFSKDGKSIAYVSYPEGILWKANRDGSNPVQLIDPPMNAFLPRWSPDSKQIVFQYFSPAVGKPSTYIVSSEGGSLPRLLNEISK